ncbi:MAG: serine/threonine protein kinase [Luteimonas sp.]
MDAINMELDDFKAAWRTIDARLQRQHALDLHRFREEKLQRMRAGMRPLFWGQLLQALFGAGIALLAFALWSTHPRAAAVIVAGVIVHAYGIACIIGAGSVLAAMAKLDNAAPVLDIQKQLSRVRKAYVVSGLVLGLPWWFLWIPFVMVLAGLLGIDVFARAPGFIYASVAVGAAGMLGTWWVYRWSRRPARARALDDALSGASLRRARAQLEELERFERD